MKIVAGILMLMSSLFYFSAALGLIRMPDLFLRMHTTSKASSLGIAGMALATAFYFSSWESFARAVLMIVFIFLSTPVSTHLIGRVALRMKIPVVPETQRK